MTLRVIGAGVGRTGTYSLKLAINRLGLGPCYHMETVRQNMSVQVPLWSAASSGLADWHAIYDGFGSAVDWPTAGFFRELNEAYPASKFVLTHRSPDRWADSFSATIHKLLGQIEHEPPEKQAWLEMSAAVITATGFPPGLDREGMKKAFVAHNEAVEATIPADRLLVFEVKDGWEPLCEFLQLPVPDEPFPRSNHREEFWDLVS